MSSHSWWARVHRGMFCHRWVLVKSCRTCDCSKEHSSVGQWREYCYLWPWAPTLEVMGSKVPFSKCPVESVTAQRSCVPRTKSK